MGGVVSFLEPPHQRRLRRDRERAKQIQEAAQKYARPGARASSRGPRGGVRKSTKQRGAAETASSSRKRQPRGKQVDAKDKASLEHFNNTIQTSSGAPKTGDAKGAVGTAPTTYTLPSSPASTSEKEIEVRADDVDVDDEASAASNVTDTNEFEVSRKNSAESAVSAVSAARAEERLADAPSTESAPSSSPPPSTVETKTSTSSAGKFANPNMTGKAGAVVIDEKTGEVREPPRTDLLKKYAVKDNEDRRSKNLHDLAMYGGGASKFKLGDKKRRASFQPQSLTQEQEVDALQNALAEERKKLEAEEAAAGRKTTIGEDAVYEKKDQ